MELEKMNKQSGFTLVELVIVIIILGIIGATAVPKFIDLQSDAQKSAMVGVKGALEGGASITYSKSAIDGEQQLVHAGDTAAEPSSNGVNTAYGYPVATADALKEAAGLATSDWTIVTTSNTDNMSEKAIITPASLSEAAQTIAIEEDETGCNVTYIQSTAVGKRPVITAYTGGC